MIGLISTGTGSKSQGLRLAFRWHPITLWQSSIGKGGPYRTRARRAPDSQIETPRPFNSRVDKRAHFLTIPLSGCMHNKHTNSSCPAARILYPKAQENPTRLEALL
jgi:hypothetical protein